jgi:curli biogenesis system outer membrane secretion channel CsgG
MRYFILSSFLSIIFGFVSSSNVYATALKKTVAVFEFSNDSGYTSLANLGQDFSVQLTDALIKSGEFIVLTRRDLDVVMAEQDLAQSGRLAKSRTAKMGKIIPAQILIKGQITEFQEQTTGGQQGLTIHGVTLGGKKSTAHVAVIIQLIDSTTGEILKSHRVEGEAKAGGFSIGYSGSWSITSSNFQKTPLGKAVQMTIDRAVNYISKEMKDIPWRGRVVLVKNAQVYINSGRNAGIQSGNSFSIYRENEALIDPETGIELGKEKTKIAEVEITEVQEKFSKAKIIEGPYSGEILKGDLVLER